MGEARRRAGGVDRRGLNRAQQRAFRRGSLGLNAGSGSSGG